MCYSEDTRPQHNLAIFLLTYTADVHVNNWVGDWLIISPCDSAIQYSRVYWLLI